jgi:hypothetical protein
LFLLARDLLKELLSIESAEDGRVKLHLAATITAQRVSARAQTARGSVPGGNAADSEECQDERVLHAQRAFIGSSSSCPAAVSE